MNEKRSRPRPVRVAARGALACLLAVAFPLAAAAEIVMKVEGTCGLSADDLMVVVWPPPGGTLPVAPNGEVATDLAVGHRLSVLQKIDGACSGKNAERPFWDPGRSDCVHGPVAVGPWQPALDGGTLPVVCR